MATPAQPANEKRRKPSKPMTVDEARTEITKSYLLLHCSGCDKFKWLPAAVIGGAPLPMCKNCRTNGKMSSWGEGPGFGIYYCEACHWKWTSDDPDVDYETPANCPSPVRKTVHGDEVCCDASSFPMGIGPFRFKRAYETLWAEQRRAAKFENTKPRRPRAQNRHQREGDDQKAAVAAAATVLAAAAVQPNALEHCSAPLVHHSFKTHVAPNAMQCANTGRAATLKLSSAPLQKARPSATKRHPIAGTWKCTRCLAVRDVRYNETTDCANCQGIGSLERVSD